MSKFALAAAFAFAGAVLASSPASASSTRLNLAGIDLNTPAGKAELAKRVHITAKGYCRDQIATGTHLMSNDCVAAVEQELNEKIASRAAATRMAANR